MFGDLCMFLGVLLLVTVVPAYCSIFSFVLEIGTELRETGDDPQMICALGASVDAGTIWTGDVERPDWLSGAVLGAVPGF